jgi:hypothetical protein
MHLDRGSGVAIEIPRSEELAYYVACENKEIMAGRAYMGYGNEFALVVVEEVVWGRALSWDFEPGLSDMVTRFEYVLRQAGEMRAVILERFGGRPCRDDELLHIVCSRGSRARADTQTAVLACDCVSRPRPCVTCSACPVTSCRYDVLMAQMTKKTTTLKARRRRTAGERGRGLLADLAPGRSLADELIAERRAGAQAEALADKQARAKQPAKR